MFYKENTPVGIIKYEKTLLSGIVLNAVLSVAEGKAFPSDSKGRPMKPEMPTSLSTYGEDFIDAEYDGDEIDITIYLIVKFGVVLSKTMEQIDLAIRKTIFEALGSKARDNKIIVTGVLSKNLSRRNLTYVFHADKTSEIPEEFGE